MSSKKIEAKLEWARDIPVNWNVYPNKYVMRKIKEVCPKYSGENILSLSMNGVIVRDIDNPSGKMPSSFDGYQKIFPNNLLMCLFDIDVTPRCVGLITQSGLTSPAYTQFELLDGMSPKYYYYYYLMMDNYKVLLHFAKNLRHSLTADQFSAIEVLVPPIDQQNKIAQILDLKCSQIDELIAIQEQEIEKLKAYKQSLITEVVTKGLDPNAEMKDSGVDWITEIPKNWETKPMKTLFTFSKGLSITKENLQESGAPVISYGQIHAKWNSGVTLHEELKRYVSESYFETGKTSLANKGDFIFADTSEDLSGCGNCAYIDKNEPIFAGYHTVILRPTQNVDTKYLAYLFLTDAWRSQIRQRVYGIKLFSVTQKILKNLSVIIPDNCEPIIKFLDEKCAHIDSLVSMKEQKISFLNNYRKSLIYEYVTGKKEV